MIVLIKRFRITLYYLLLFAFTMAIADGLGPDWDFLFGLAVFIWFPLIFISYVKYWVMTIKDLINYAKGYALPEDKPTPEMKFIKGRIKAVKDEISCLEKLPIKSRIIRVMIGILAIAILILGIYFFSKSMYVAGGYILAVGTAIWFVRLVVNK